MSIRIGGNSGIAKRFIDIRNTSLIQISDVDLTGNGSYGASNTYGNDMCTLYYSGPQSSLATAHLNTSFNNAVFEIGCLRTTTTSYLLWRGFSGNGSDTAYQDDEAHLDGTGKMFLDGTLSTGGADYAEMFEWEDGNPNEENRSGLSVVLVNEKIRLATNDDDPTMIIGVISGRPAVLGDSPIDAWPQKYKTDIWGRFLSETYQEVNWTDAEGVPSFYEVGKVPEGIIVPENANYIIQERRVTNPDYDPNQTYKPRTERKEWAAVGLMGKLNVKNGTPIGDQWIKMKEISTTIDQYLVR